MKLRAVIVRMFIATIACGFVMSAAAQDSQIEPGSERPMFTRLKPTLHSPRTPVEAAGTPLQTWNGSFTFNGTTFNYNMVGTPPSSTSAATVAAVIIPVKIVLSNGTTFDPSGIVSKVTGSPIFATGVDFTSGGVDFGSTQYINAFQRANFYGVGHSGFGILLSGPTVKPLVTLNVPKRSGKTGVDSASARAWWTSTTLMRSCTRCLLTWASLPIRFRFSSPATFTSRRTTLAVLADITARPA